MVYIGMAREDGQFKKGVAKGRPKGAVNKLTRTVRQTVLDVFNDLQDDSKTDLKAFAKRFPRDFYNIAAKLIPTEITGTVKNVIKVKVTDE